MTETIQVLEREPRACGVVDNHRTYRNIRQFTTDHHGRNLPLAEFGQQLAIEVEWVGNRDYTLDPPPQQHVETGLELRAVVLQISHDGKQS